MKKTCERGSVGWPVAGHGEGLRRQVQTTARIDSSFVLLSLHIFGCYTSLVFLRLALLPLRQGCHPGRRRRAQRQVEPAKEDGAAQCVGWRTTKNVWWVSAMHHMPAFENSAHHTHLPWQQVLLSCSSRGVCDKARAVCVKGSFCKWGWVSGEKNSQGIIELQTVDISVCSLKNRNDHSLIQFHFGGKKLNTLEPSNLCSQAIHA